MELTLMPKNNVMFRKNIGVVILKLRFFNSLRCIENVDQNRKHQKTEKPNLKQKPKRNMKTCLVKCYNLLQNTCFDF